MAQYTYRKTPLNSEEKIVKLYVGIRGSLGEALVYTEKGSAFAELTGVFNERF